MAKSQRRRRSSCSQPQQRYVRQTSVAAKVAQLDALWFTQHPGKVRLRRYVKGEVSGIDLHERWIVVQEVNGVRVRTTLGMLPDDAILGVDAETGELVRTYTDQQRNDLDELLKLTRDIFAD